MNGCVPLRWSELDSSKPKCFHTTEFALPFFLTKGCLSAIFYRPLLQLHWQYAQAWLKAKISRRSGVYKWRWKGLPHSPHKTRHAAEWWFYYDYLIFMSEGSHNRNRNWNSINRPALAVSAISEGALRWAGNLSRKYPALAKRQLRLAPAKTPTTP